MNTILLLTVKHINRAKIIYSSGNLCRYCGTGYRIIFNLMILYDINGLLIEVGDTVETQQPGGGILPPGAPQIGEVIESPDWIKRGGSEDICLQFFKGADPHPRYILLQHKINTMVKKG